MKHRTSWKGDIGVAVVTADLVKSGIDVMMPISEHLPFDLVAFDGESFHKVQVKYVAADRTGKLEVKLRKHVSHGGVYGKNRMARFTDGEIDVLAIYCPDTDLVYYVRSKDFPTGYVTLRLTPAKNSQKKGVTDASTCVGWGEVRGSNPRPIESQSIALPTELTPPPKKL